MSISEKIAYIVPSEALKVAVEDILCEEIKDGLIDVMLIDVHNPEGEYQRLCDSGYGCIVARGGTYSELQRIAGPVPVMEEVIRTADILEMISSDENLHQTGAVAILHRGTADGADNLAKLSEGKLKIYRYDTLDSLKKILADLPATNENIYTSAYAASITDRDDLNLIEIRNRPHTIRVTVATARKFVEQLEDNIRRVNTLNSIYNNIDEGLIIFDRENIILEANQRAILMFDSGRNDVIGKSVYELVAEMPDKRPDGTCSIESPRNFMGELGDNQINYTVYPFESYRGSTRYMMILQDVTKIQSLERSIRLEIAKKGHLAKYNFEDIQTCEPIMEHTIEKAKTIAAYEGSVMIYGESGTGKELFAQSIHNASNRKNGPFVAINCAALTESLLESELFGYVSGSFTGASKNGKVGLFELAHNGTIFLDEVNSTPLSLQAKILRVIESQQVMRVGSDYVIPIDVRVISASNNDLDTEIENGSFRRDLYYRLSTFELRVAPIRERKKDILLLFKYYLSKFAASAGGASPDDIVLDPSFEKTLLSHQWLGNVREIRSVALRYDAFSGDNSNGDILKPYKDQPNNLSEGIMYSNSHPESDSAIVPENDTVDLSNLSGAVEEMVIRSLEESGLTKTEIARRLGISRQALYKKLKKF